jgi:hypothetical protein
MRQAIGLACAAAMAAALLTHATVAGQTPEFGSSFVAFRVDGTRVVATIKVMDISAQQVTDGLSAEPIARFGYRYFDPPALWREQHAADMRAGDRWLIHTAPRQAFHAETERIVGGNAGCQDAIGVLLRVLPEQTEAFAALPAKYFLAERSTTAESWKAESSSTVGVAPSSSGVEFRGALESTLNALLLRELPRVRSETAGELERMASSSVGYHRSWASQRRAVDEAMQRGRGKLTYDIQSFRLAPDGVLLHFVRAEWFVRQQQGFAASLWLRGEQPGDVFDTNLAPASWLRMFEFQGKVAREHLGLVLNVFDRDHDGWGEVLLARGGYESMNLSLLEYSLTGFQPTGIGYGFGC